MENEIEEYCIKCGKKLPDEALFCPSCGTKCKVDCNDINPNILDEQNDTETSTVNKTSSVTTKNNPKKFAAICFALLILVVVIVSSSKCEVCGDRGAHNNWYGYKVCDDCYNSLNSKSTSSSSYSTDYSSDENTTSSSNTTTYSATIGEQNALNKAHSYLNYSAFSYSGLVEQLEYEGYSNSEATYAADNCGANWNEQAAKKAQDYMEYSSFSRQGLIEQLEYEGFTSSQAEYGVSQVGY